ncbi:MAG TPA: response regulator transcription factor [Thermodesulfovibrionales bacterium]|nr:response regulator transcription factor [Thermodesulfovibrionales bacterium]
MIRVLIADDHPLLREGLKLICSETKDIHVVDEASNGEEVLDKVKKDDFDVLVLDINMPRKGGFEVLDELRASGNKIPVLVLSTYSEEDYKELAIKAGAAGYLTKEQAPDRLIEEIRRVSKGG